MLIKNKTDDPRKLVEDGRSIIVEPGETHETRHDIRENNIWEIVGTDSKETIKSKKQTKEVDNHGSRSN